MNAEMATFRSDLETNNMRPLWDVMRKLAPRTPANGGDPVHWPWSTSRKHLLRAGEVITAEEAERRVLVLENPAFRGEGRATSSMYAGIQLILPGETAGSHRHTAAALRLVLEGNGAYTAVNGERVRMSPGDFIVTPSNTFHDHGNDSNEPVMWLDGLDVVIVNLLNAAFAEDDRVRQPPVIRPAGDSLARYGSGLLPHGFERQASGSPLFSWPYERTRNALYTLSRNGEIDPALGIRMTHVDPTTGSSPIKTITAATQLFPKGFVGTPYRSTAGTVMTVIEGSAEVTVGGHTWSVREKDAFVVPSWQWHSVRAAADTVIFGFSDEVLQRHLGFWREARSATETEH